jgi:hypothetical protein
MIDRLVACALALLLVESAAPEAGRLRDRY